MQRLYAFLALCLLLIARPADADLRDSVVGQLKRYQQLTDISVTGLDAEALDDLLRGKPVYRSVRLSGNDDDKTVLRIVGYRLIDAPREDLWLAALAFDGEFSERLHEYLLSTDDDGGALWYQYVNMPWPLRNRQWLIQTGKNLDLSAETDGAIWEHRWSLADDGRARVDRLIEQGGIGELDGDNLEGAIMLPRNNGAWVMTQTSTGRTLVMLHATMDLGGWIPDSMVNRYTRKQLTNMLEKIERDSASARQSYDGSYPIYRGDGSLIPATADAPAS